MQKSPIEISSGGQLCRGMHWAPESVEGGLPCVVLAPGFGGTYDGGLIQFAEGHCRAGSHAVAFDYRHFGASDGEPRQLLSIRRQLADWKAAIAFARGLEGVDPDRIAIVGTSFSGGHVLVVASEDERLAAVVAQCPLMDGRQGLVNLAKYAGAGYLVRILLHGLRDLFRSLTGRSPWYVPIVGAPGTIAAMTSPDAWSGVMDVSPPDYRNEVCARIGLTLGFYRPIKRAPQVRCPLLIQMCERDNVAPIAAAEAVTAKVSGPAEIVRYDCGHFDIYQAPWFERSSGDQIKFLRRAFA